MNDNLKFLRRVTAVMIIFAFLFVSFSIGVSPQKAQENSGGNMFDKFKIKDAVTRAVRDQSKDFVRVQINKLSDRERAGKFGTIVEDYGSFVVLAKNKTSDLSKSKLDVQPLDASINLPAGKFNPLDTGRVGTIKPNSAATESTGKNYYIVQFGGIATDEWLDSLKADGAEIIQYVPNQAFFVYADGAAISKIANHSRVRWVGQYLADDKISPELNDFTRRVQGATATFDIAVFARADLAEVSLNLTNTVQGQIINVIKLPNNYFNIVRMEIPLGEISKIAALADVVRIDQYEKPSKEDERANQIVAGNFINATTLSGTGYNPLTQFGVNGQNVTVSVADDGVGIPGDGGFYITSGNAVDGPLRGAAVGANGHGHLNATIIAGDTPFSPTLDPTGYNYGIGIAPKANIINLPFLRTGSTSTEADLYNDTITTAGPNGVLGSISNNSWGNGTNSNSYDSYAAQFDGYVRDASTAATIDPICLVFSAGNSGASGLTRPKVAKNLISVAAAENLRPELAGTAADSLEAIASFSSRGLAADGRVKPDISAPGSGVSGGRSGPDVLFGNIDTVHRWSEGTSHAAPLIAGAAALFTQYWKNTHSGVNPSPALIKAAIINAAQEMTGTLATAPIPNGFEGWGRLNMKGMLNTGVATKYINQTSELSTVGTSASYSGTISDSSKPVRISLVWTDPPGVGNPALVNNLDLTVTIGANVYKGNVFTSGVSTTGGTADTLNNVENVLLPAGIAAGTPITVQIGATALNGDGILGNADTTDQHFSLVAYNFSEQQAVNRNKTSDFDGDGKADLAVYRPSNNTWYVLRSSDSAFIALAFGITGDIIAPGDYDGDGKTDYGIFRPSNGTWYLQRSTAGFTAVQFGANGDIPVPGDYNGDNRTDFAVFRPSNGTWYTSLDLTTNYNAQRFGISTDKPVQGDYDGDGRTDIAVFRPSGGDWYVSQSTAGLAITHLGDANDKPAQADYDGDGKVDIGVFRPSNGVWYLQRSTAGFAFTNFGTSGDAVAPADYDNDGKADLGIFRPSTGTWYLQRSAAGFLQTPFGANGDIPVASGYIPVQ